MIIPLDQLLKEEDNVYVTTCASIRRAYQLTVIGDEDVEQNLGKVVSVAIKQIVSRKVHFRIAE